LPERRYGSRREGCQGNGLANQFDEANVPDKASSACQRVFAQSESQRIGGDDIVGLGELPGVAPPKVAIGAPSIAVGFLPFLVPIAVTVRL
jgi:hypothetical protein